MRSIRIVMGAKIKRTSVWAGVNCLLEFLMGISKKGAKKHDLDIVCNHNTLWRS